MSTANQTKRSPHKDLLNKNIWLVQLDGVFGSLLFFIGSICFLFPAAKLAGTWLFIIGSGSCLLSFALITLNDYWQRDD